jgi:hypothetical protein
MGLAGLVILAGLCVGATSLSAANPSEALFNGKDLGGWKKPSGEWMTAQKVAADPAEPRRFNIEPGAGILVNGTKGRTVNLVSEFEHGDVEAEIEFMVPKNSNSGVYFQGRYEVQILDSWGVEKPAHSDCGGIYERWKEGKGFEGHAPRVNASRPPGEWQKFEVIFRAPRFDAGGKKIENARFVKVIHNGTLIHENVELTGPTRAATFEHDEKPKGPIMLQGDHGPVAFRTVLLKPVQLK